MPLQKLPVQHLDDINHRRRARETLNKVLDHSFDDSRVQTPAEELAGITPVNYAYPPFDVRRYGAKGDGVTDDTAAIQSAINVAEINGGDVYLPTGNHLVSVDPSTPDVPALIIEAAHVSFYGDGSQASLITADNCNVFSLEYTSGFGNSMFREFAINGSGGTTRVAIKVPGTLDDSDELYGLTIENLLITNFNKCVSFRTVRNFSIRNCWFQHTHIAVDLLGKNLSGRVESCSLIYANGNGTGDVIGIDMGYFNYTDGIGNVAPEGVVLAHNWIFGFDTPVRITAANVVTGIGNDLSGRVVGLDLTTIQNGFSWTGGTVEMSGANAVAAIKIRPLASTIIASFDFTGVGITGGAGITSCSGYEINNTGQTNNGNISIRGGVILGMVDRDIMWWNPSGHNLIDGVHCSSTSTTYSIEFVNDASASDGHLTVVCNNQCENQIVVPSVFTTAGTIRVFNNRDEDTNTKHANAVGWYEEGTWTPADASGAGLSFSSVSATYTKVGNKISARFALTYPATGDGTANLIGGLPFTVANNAAARQGFLTSSTNSAVSSVLPNANATTFSIRTPANVQSANSVLSGVSLSGTLEYPIA